MAGSMPLRHRGPAEPERPPSGGGPDGALTISAVAARTGLAPSTLRLWEQRHGLVPSHTTPGGHRRYSRDDVERILAVQRLVHGGLTTGEAARAVLALSRHDVPIPAGADPLAHRACAAALDLDGPTLRWLLREHLTRAGAASIWDTVIRPVLGPVGDRWAQLPHGIAVEHLISHVTTTVLGEATPAPPRPHAPAVLLASVPDDQHDLPLVALAAVLGVGGISTTMLGAATPSGVLADAVDRRRPGVVVLHAQLRELADPGLLLGAGVRLASGPGWNGTRLPPGVLHVDDLTSAVDAVTAHVQT